MSYSELTPSEMCDRYTSNWWRTRFKNLRMDSYRRDTPNEFAYKEYLFDVLEDPVLNVNERTGVGCISKFGMSKTFDLSEKKMAMPYCRAVWTSFMLDEFLWIWKLGSTNIEDLEENHRRLWSKWASQDGDLGKIYGYVARGDYDDAARHPDQLESLITEISENPSSRRLVMSLWDRSLLKEQNLACCHGTAIQFHIDQRKAELSTTIMQRSADLLIGVPTNLAHYSVLTHLIASIFGYKAKQMHYTLGDGHIYLNHLEDSTMIERVLSFTEGCVPKLNIKLSDSIRDGYNDPYNVMTFINEDLEKGNFGILDYSRKLMNPGFELN